MLRRKEARRWLKAVGVFLCLTVSALLLGCEPKEGEWETSPYLGTEASDGTTAEETAGAGGETSADEEAEADSVTDSKTEAVWSPFV